MEKIKWCIKKGMKIIEPNEEIGKGYLQMGKDALGTMKRERGKNTISSISAGYYSMYYSLYAIMQKIGVKCEIHSCSIEFMKKFLENFYSQKDIELIETAFAVRNLLQYYVGKNVNKDELKIVWSNAYDFFVVSRDIFAKINEGDIKEIRGRLNE
jgi:uncharacterized protein (UPF0332 family)